LIDPDLTLKRPGGDGANGLVGWIAAIPAAPEHPERLKPEVEFNTEVPRQ
jgi:hypothetical protein